MFSLDRWQEILSTMWRNPWRTLLTAQGVFWGIFMLIVLLGSGNGLENGVLSNFQGFDVNGMYVWGQRTTMPYKGFKPGRFYTLRNADTEAIREQVPELQHICPRAQLGGYGSDNNVGRGTRTGSYSVFGDHPEFRFIQLLDIKQGRFVNQTDMDETRKICVIGEMVAKELFDPGENPIGDYIKIQGVYFKVVGVFGTNKKGNEALKDLTSIYIPFSTFQRAFNWGDKLAWFALSVKKGFDSYEVEEKVKQVIMAQHTIHPDDTRAIGSFNAAKEAQKFNRMFGGISFLVGLVGIGTLFAGGIGVMNIMLITVNERTKEIGIRKAMGATPASIIGMIMQEAVFITFVAGYLGLALGVFTLEAVDAFIGEPETSGKRSDFIFFMHPEVSFATAMFSVGVLMVTGMLAGLYPALKAVWIDPIKALRTE